jgi:hypothetical protein
MKKSQRTTSAAQPRLTVNIALVRGTTARDVRLIVRDYLNGCTVEGALRALCADALNCLANRYPRRAGTKGSKEVRP